MGTYRQYSEEDKAVVLTYFEATGGNQRKTSRDCNVPLATLQDWIAGEGVNDAVTEKAVTKKGELADKLEDLAHLIADAMPAKIKDARLQPAAVAFGVVVDKMRLLREQATQITDDASLSDDELDRRIAAAEARKTQAAGGAGEVVQPAPPDPETV